jgi:hypothetical protein
MDPTIQGMKSNHISLKICFLGPYILLGPSKIKKYPFLFGEFSPKPFFLLAQFRILFN